MPTTADVLDSSVPHPSVNVEEMPGLMPAVTIASGQLHGPGADLYRLEWTGRRWRSRPRIVRATDEERRCVNPACRRLFPCSAFRRSSWPY